MTERWSGGSARGRRVGAGDLSHGPARRRVYYERQRSEDKVTTLEALNRILWGSRQVGRIQSSRHHVAREAELAPLRDVSVSSGGLEG